MERREKLLCIALAIVSLILALVVPAFYHPQPFLSLVTSRVPALLAVIGTVLVILTRQIDISIGSTLGISAVVIGHLNSAGVSMPLSAVAGILTAGALGSFNGALVAFLRLPSIVVTLATLVIGAEVLRLTQRGQFIPLKAGAQWFGLPQTAGQLALILSAVTLLLGCDFLLRHLRAGRSFYAVGSNAESARLSGISPTATTFAAFTCNGLTAGLAAVCSVVQSPQVDPKCGVGMEMTAIAAAVIGGVSVNGGKGGLRGAALGLMLLSIINPALTHLHVDAYWEKAIQGAVILMAVLSESKRAKPSPSFRA
jgi:rhamnose transport system permease protein